GAARQVRRARGPRTIARRLRARRARHRACDPRAAGPGRTAPGHGGRLRGGVMRIATIAAALAVTAVTTATAECTPKDSAAANKALDRVNTWDQLHKSWKDWNKCDSGPVADAFTDAIMRLGVDWKNMDALARDMAADAQYHDFILAHVKSD